MRFIYTLAIILILLLILTFSLQKFIFAQSANTATSDYIQIKNVTVDKNYLLALNAANQFLGSWLMRDLEKGSEFITEDLKNKLGYNGLFAFFTGTSNPHHQGFEIIGAKHINETKIRFYVWLYEYYTAENVTPYKRPLPYYIDVVKFNEYIWKVANLPVKVNF